MPLIVRSGMAEIYFSEKLYIIDIITILILIIFLLLDYLKEKERKRERKGEKKKWN